MATNNFYNSFGQTNNSRDKAAAARNATPVAVLKPGVSVPQPNGTVLATAAPKVAAAAAPQQILSGGGGGGSAARAGGGGGVVAPAPIVRPNLDDYIKGNFLYKQQEAENEDGLADFDAQTDLGREDTRQTQLQREQELQRNLDEQGTGSAEDLAGRGLLRSGINFQQQDKINAFGAQRRSGIADLMTDFEGQRGQGRIAQQAQNRAALNERIAALTQQFQTDNLATII